MKKNRKCIIVLAAALLILLAGCGRNASSGSNAAPDAGGGISEDAGVDTDFSDAEDGGTDADSSDEDDAGTGYQDLWSVFSVAAIDGQTVSYGPITITLPDGYEVVDGTEKSSLLRFSAKDREDQGYVPSIGFQMLTMAEYSSDPEANKAAFIEGMQESFSGNESAKVKEVFSYNEAEAGGYKAVKLMANADVAGTSLVTGAYMIFEKTEGLGRCVMIGYAGLESDTEGLAAWEAALDGISQRTDTSDVVSDAHTPATDWQSVFADGSALTVDGNSVTFGPLQMELPDGYAVEDESAESPMFYNADRTGCFNFVFGEDSYHTMSDRDYVENEMKEQYEGAGMTDVSLGYHEKISIDGYDGYQIGIKAILNGERIVQYMTVVFESTDESPAPMIMVTFMTNEDTAMDAAKEVDTALESIRLVGE